MDVTIPVLIMLGTCNAGAVWGLVMVMQMRREISRREKADQEVQDLNSLWLETLD